MFETQFYCGYNGTVDGAVIPSEHDLNIDSVVDGADFDMWLANLAAAGLYKDFTGEPVWIFDIADLVVFGWDYENNGSKLVQVRFYPVAPTVAGRLEYAGLDTGAFDALNIFDGNQEPRTLKWRRLR